MVLIKRYGNRRLYDTELSRYITVADLCHKVQRGVDVEVRDARTGEDLTQAFLVQLLIEQRGGGKAIPRLVVQQLIRLDDSRLEDFLARQLPAALAVYQETHGKHLATVPYMRQRDLSRDRDAFASMVRVVSAAAADTGRRRRRRSR